jgi:hypothetical protein
MCCIHALVLLRESVKSAAVGGGGRPPPVVLVAPAAFRDNGAMSLPENFYEPSPGPWAFLTHVYGLSHTLIDWRDPCGPALQAAPPKAL